jgi:hypothetical protein
MWWLWLVGCDAPAPPAEEPPARCNGRVDLCDLPLPQVPILVAHNAMNSREDGWLVPNQNLAYEAQVADGVRGFMLDVHDLDGAPTLCHGPCELGSEDLVAGLERFAALLEAYPREVFVFVVQDGVEPEPIARAFEAAGLLDDVIVDLDPWPTLAESIQAGTRLLVTHERGRADAPAWYHATYDLGWDNDYAARTVEDFGCEPLRGDPDHDVFLLNHFLTAPIGTEALAAQANTREALLDHIERCEAQWQRPISWLAVDFYDVGDSLEVLSSLPSL